MNSFLAQPAPLLSVDVPVFNCDSAAQGGVPVTTAAGTIQVQGRAGEDAHWQNISNGTFNAADISDPARTQAGASGPLRQWRVLLTGITIATQFSAYVDKYV